MKRLCVFCGSSLGHSPVFADCARELGSTLADPNQLNNVLLNLAIVLAGVIGYRSIPVSALPSYDTPVINVSAVLPGANPDTMASAVATPLEKAFSNIAGIDSMSSASITAHMFHQCLPCGFTYRNSCR